MEDIRSYKQRAAETHYIAQGDPAFLQAAGHSAVGAKAGLTHEPVNLWECNLAFNSTEFFDELIERGLVEGVDFDKLITGNPDAVTGDEEDDWTEVFVRALSTNGKVIFKLLKRSYSLFDETAP